MNMKNTQTSQQATIYVKFEYSRCWLYLDFTLTVFPLPRYGHRNLSKWVSCTCSTFQPCLYSISDFVGREKPRYRRTKSFSPALGASKKTPALGQKHHTSVLSDTSVPAYPLPPIGKSHYTELERVQRHNNLKRNFERDQVLQNPSKVDYPSRRVQPHLLNRYQLKHRLIHQSNIFPDAKYSSFDDSFSNQGHQSRELNTYKKAPPIRSRSQPNTGNSIKTIYPTTPEPPLVRTQSLPQVAWGKEATSTSNNIQPASNITQETYRNSRSAPSNQHSNLSNLPQRAEYQPPSFDHLTPGPNRLHPIFPEQGMSSYLSSPHRRNSFGYGYGNPQPYSDPYADPQGEVCEASS